jgi:hypothetical protein
MENCAFLNPLKKYFFGSFSMLEKILEICPDELWNKKAAGIVFWQQLAHAFGGAHYWLREENTEFIDPFKDQNIYLERMEKDPESILSKGVLRQYCKEIKEIAEKWFNGRDDDWLKLPSKIYNKATNNEAALMQIKHIMYHVGHCEAVFRENGIETGEYIN